VGCCHLARYVSLWRSSLSRSRVSTETGNLRVLREDSPTWGCCHLASVCSFVAGSLSGAEPGNYLSVRPSCADVHLHGSNQQRAVPLGLMPFARTSNDPPRDAGVCCYLDERTRKRSCIDFDDGSQNSSTVYANVAADPVFVHVMRTADTAECEPSKRFRPQRARELLGTACPRESCTAPHRVLGRRTLESSWPQRPWPHSEPDFRGTKFSFERADNCVCVVTSAHAQPTVLSPAMSITT